MSALGAYEAKTHLPGLFQRVENGETITITRHGREVARPVPTVGARPAVVDTVAALRDVRRSIRRGPTLVRHMIEEGRR